MYVQHAKHSRLHVGVDVKGPSVAGIYLVAFFCF